MVNAYLILTSVITSACCACPDGWLPHADKCYHFSHDKETFPGAKTMCDIIGGTLVEIEDEAENKYLGAQVGLTTFYYWIGLSDVQEENSWVWINSKYTAEYTNWHPGEPNNQGDNENCAVMIQSGEWYDHPCANQQHYICERNRNDEGLVVG